MLGAYCGAQDHRAPLSMAPQRQQIQQQKYQEFVQVSKKDWALMLEIGTPADSVLAYQPSKNGQSYEHYRWMMYRPSDYIDSGMSRPKPNSQLVNYTIPR